MYLFYASNIADELVLPEEESSHCVQVLRRAAGDEILVTDGAGQLYHCVITNPHRKHCEVKIPSRLRRRCTMDMCMLSWLRPRTLTARNGR